MSPPILRTATPAPLHAAARPAASEILCSPPSPSPRLPPPLQISLERLETEDEFKVIIITF